MRFRFPNTNLDSNRKMISCWYQNYFFTDLTTDSDLVEATKRESKDTQPVKKVRTCSVIM